MAGSFAWVWGREQHHQALPEPAQGVLEISPLGSFPPANHHDPAGSVVQADRGEGLVLVLPPDLQP